MAVSRKASESSQFRFSEINMTTGVITPLSPLGPITLAGLAATPDGRFFGLTSATAGATSQLYSVDVTTNTPTLIGDMVTDDGYRFASLDILTDGRAFAVSISRPRLFSVDLETAAVTAVNEPDTITQALQDAGALGFSASTLSLGSVGDVLYTIDTATKSLVSLNPDTGAAHVVGGAAGLMWSGELSNGIPRSRYTAFAALTGVDADRDGEFDELIGAISSFDDDNNAATPAAPLGGVAKFDLSTALWDLIGTNPGVSFASFASVPARPAPEPSCILLAMLGFVPMQRNPRRPHAERRSA